MMKVLERQVEFVTIVVVGFVEEVVADRSSAVVAERAVTQSDLCRKGTLVTKQNLRSCLNWEEQLSDRKVSERF